VAGSGLLAAGVSRTCAELGAAVLALPVDPAGGEAGASGLPAAPVLVWDGDGALASAGGGVAGVHAALDGAWLAVRPVAAACMTETPGGRIVLLAPRPGDAHREAARAGLENLARTLGIEWSRLGIRIVTILPGAGTPAEDVGQFTAYLASPAGDYFSGCALTLRR
jgi:NAD(P)-dependent dehydrogenase (short-subunit alcohol dehydrogenase family)